jgi:hypothetical protein
MFIFEDGTGIPDANAYIDIPFVEKYLMGNRLAQFNDLSDDDKCAAIISGTQLVDISYEWEGNRKSIEQGLNWPRTGVELYGFTVEGIPLAVKKASCEAVWLYMTEDSLFSSQGDRYVVRERVEGAVDISYANPKDRVKDNVTRFEILDKLLRGLYVTDTGASGGSSIGSAQVERV